MLWFILACNLETKISEPVVKLLLMQMETDSLSRKIAMTQMRPSIPPHLNYAMGQTTTAMERSTKTFSKIFMLMQMEMGLAMQTSPYKAVRYRMDSLAMTPTAMIPTTASFQMQRRSVTDWTTTVMERLILDS